MNRALDRLEDALASIAAAMIVFTVIFVPMDVASRYFFGAPITWVYEVTEYILLMVPCLAMAWLARHNGHVVIDALTSRLPERARARLAVATELAVAATCALRRMVGGGRDLHQLQGRRPDRERAADAAVDDLRLHPGRLRPHRHRVRPQRSARRVEWWLILSIIFGSLLLLLALGVPVAFAFLIINLAGAALLQGGAGAFQQLIHSIYGSVTSFSLLPIPLFVLMGEILWQTNIAARALTALDKLLGRVPGRLSLLTVLSGTIFAALSGSTIANTAMLGSLLLPDLKKRGYADDLSMGAIMASGALAMLIPPSALAVIFAVIAKISIGKVLIALIAPGPAARGALRGLHHAARDVATRPRRRPTT